MVVRKLGLPGHQELAMGAVGPCGARVINHEVVRLLRIPAAVIDAAASREQEEVERRERSYRRGLPPQPMAGRSVILVDDGLATGASMRAAVACARASGTKRVTVAVPTGAHDTCEELRREVDETVCLSEPEPFVAVGQHYEDFTSTSDEEVRDLLARAAQTARPAHAPLHR
jgi:predicted phosphoribosyltransferase